MTKESTNREAVQLQYKILNRMSPGKRLKLAENLYMSARELKAAGLRASHPDLSEEEIRQKVKEFFLYARS